MVRFDIITLFPGIVENAFQESIIKKGVEKGSLSIHVHNLRRFTTDRHMTADDAPYGGGSGMVMKVEPIVRAVEAIRDSSKKGRVILTSPQGTVYCQDTAKRLSTYEQLIIICGRYEGVDERVLNFVDEEISIGDYVLTGGEIPSMVIVDTVSRLIPGVVGDINSVLEDTFSDGLLKYPQYTRPETFRTLSVPQVLLSGNHQRIRAWRRKQSLGRTFFKRPDLLKKTVLARDEQQIIDEIEQKKELEFKDECD